VEVEELSFQSARPGRSFPGGTRRKCNHNKRNKQKADGGDTGLVLRLKDGGGDLINVSSFDN
jgi:hypothetical protein